MVEKNTSTKDHNVTTHVHDTVNNADIGNATLLEGDEKLPQGMGLQSLNVQEPSLEQDAVNDVSPPAVPSTEQSSSH